MRELGLLVAPAQPGPDSAVGHDASPAWGVALLASRGLGSVLGEVGHMLVTTAGDRGSEAVPGPAAPTDTSVPRGDAEVGLLGSRMQGPRALHWKWVMMTHGSPFFWKGQHDLGSEKGAGLSATLFQGAAWQSPPVSLARTPPKHLGLHFKVCTIAVASEQ